MDQKLLLCALTAITILSSVSASALSVPQDRAVFCYLLVSNARHGTLQTAGAQ